MRGSSHIIGGAITGLAVSNKFNLNPFITVGISIVGSLIVDIDEEHSKINNLVFPVKTEYRNVLKIALGSSLVFLPYNLAKYLGLIILISVLSCKVKYKLSLWNGLQKFSYHRTILHDPIIGGMLFITPMYMLALDNKYVLPFLFGIISHYILDSFTSYGLPVYILGGRRLRFPITYKSGNYLMEYGMLGLYVFVVLYVCLNNMPNKSLLISFFSKYLC